MTITLANYTSTLEQNIVKLSTKEQGKAVTLWGSIKKMFLLQKSLESNCPGACFLMKIIAGGL